MRYLCLCLIFFCACAKDKAIPGTRIRVKTMTEMDGNRQVTNTRSFSYNEDGNILQDGPASYSYTTNRVTIDVSSNAKIVYYLNAQGLADSSQSILKANDSVTLTDFYQYDSQGYLTDMTRSTDPLFHRYYVYGNGNCILESLANSSSDSIAVAMTYDLTKLNTVGTVNFGQPFLGSQNKNAFKTTKYTYPTTMGAFLLTYDYHYDALGRIDTEYHHYASGEMALVVYTYD